MPFDMNRLRTFFGSMLRLGIIVTILYGLIGFIWHMQETGDAMGFLGTQTLQMFIVFIILEYVGYLMITGKFHPPTTVQGKPTRRPPPRQQQQQPIQRRPSEIQIDTCSFCGKEHPIQSMREFTDKNGYRLLICSDCLK